MLTASSQPTGPAERAQATPLARGLGWLLGLNLRARTLGLVAAMLGLLMLLLFFPLRSILLDNTLRLEAKLVAVDVGRAVETLNARIAALARTTRSYGVWDDTYHFAEGDDPSYPVVSHAVEAFVAEDRDVVLIRNGAGVELLHKAVDLSSGAERPPLPLPPPLPGAPDPLFAHHDAKDVHSGLLWDARGPLMVAAAPILHSDGSGPIAGTLLLGRGLSPADVASLGASISLDVDLYAASAALPPDVAKALPDLHLGGPPLVRALSETRVAGYTLLADAYGRPAIVLRAVEGRDVYAQGHASSLYLALALLCAVVIVGGAILLLLEYTLLARLARLNTAVALIGGAGDSGARLPVAGRDELSQLAGSINAMLAALERAEEGRRQEAEERLRLQGEVLEAERQLISRVSHELRTPLTPIKGFVDLLLMNGDGTFGERQLEVLQIVRSNTDRMIALVDELLEIERAQGGRLELQMGPVDVGAVVASAIGLLRADAERKSLGLFTIVGPLPMIEADGRRLEQIVVNLVSNAVKYTPPNGSVEVRAYLNAPGWLTIAVRDSGIGLTAEQQKKLFTPFYRADSPLHTANNGTGLGLLITRTLAELHKGRIQVESEYGAGSTFSLIMPLSQG